MLPRPPVCETRIQQVLFSPGEPDRSQWKRTFTRPYSSVKISSPSGPVMIAVSRPWTIGRGVVLGACHTTLAGTASIMTL